MSSTALTALVILFVLWLLMMSFFLGLGFGNGHLLQEKQKSAHLEELLEEYSSQRKIEQERINTICSHAPDACKGIE